MKYADKQIIDREEKTKIIINDATLSDHEKSR